MAMTYTNKTMPYRTAALWNDNDVSDAVEAVLGTRYEVIFDSCYPAVGCSAYGPYEEADILFVKDGRTWQLSYDFMEVNGIGRVFRFETYDIEEG